jgi:2-keto-3-deoxy-L-rhamnonate aldolase RhmA
VCRCTSAALAARGAGGVPPRWRAPFGANRGTDYNAGIADKAAYYHEANEQMLVCALLEDVAVLDNLDAILSVPGIDLYSIGPIGSGREGLRFEPSSVAS